MSKKQGNCALILMDQICPILCDNWEIELHTNPLPFQNSFGIALDVKISIEKFSFFQGWATNRAIFSEWTVKTVFVYIHTAYSQVAHALPFLPCSTLRVKHLFLFRFSIGKCCLFTFAFARPEVKQPFKLSKRYNIRNIN